MQRRKLKRIGQDRVPVIYLFTVLETELCENGTFTEFLSLQLKRNPFGA